MTQVTQITQFYILSVNGGMRYEIFYGIGGVRRENKRGFWVVFD